MKSSPAFQMYRIVQEYKEIVLDYYPGKISIFDFFVLQHINSCKEVGCTQYDLAKVMHVSPARINPVIKKLIADDMVIFSHDNSTMRVKKIIKITKTGENTVNGAVNRSHTILDNSNEPENEGYDDYVAFKRYAEFMFEKISDYKNE